MKKGFTLISLFISLVTVAQNCPVNRYLDPIFSVTKQSDVVFGNAPTIPAVYVSEGVTIDQDLTMDIFQPTGDTATKRPLIIFAFGGGYIVGSKEDSDIQGLCDYFAKRGYVTASINYRKGLNATSNTSAVRAIYRGAQDWSSALRWFKHFSNTYKVDTNYIFVGGSSAGSFGALHMAFADDSNKPAEANADGFPNFMPDLGCLSCSGNNYHHSHAVKAVLNCWGAMLNKNFIDAGDKARLLSVHGTTDPIVPYNSGSPFSASILVQSVDGSAPMHARATQVGVSSKIIPYINQGHCVWGICILNAWAPNNPTEFYNPILDSMRVFMYPMLQPSNPTIIGPAQICAGDTAVYYTNNSNAVRFCWEVTGGTVIDHTPNYGAIKVIWNPTGTTSLSVIPYSHLGAAGNPVNQVITVNAYPALPTITQQGDTLTTAPGYTYQWYNNDVAINGATANNYIVTQTGTYSVEATNTGGCALTSVGLYVEHTVIQPNGINEAGVGIKIYPNPTNGVLIIEGIANPQVTIYNSFGQICSITDVAYTDTKTSIRHTLAKGIYYLKIVSAQGVIAKVFGVE